MSDLVNYFDNLSQVSKLVWIFICLSFFLLLENIIPLFKGAYGKWRHGRTNLVFLFTTILINALFGLATAGLFVWQAKNSFGLFYLVDLPLIVQLILSIMLLDLVAQYTVHYLLHKVKFMWRFHMVHHSDTMVDATTGTRHHPGDYMMREFFSLIAIVLVGMPFGFYVLYRMLTILFTYFSHANIVLPNFVDRTLGLVFITPNMHKFHHHFERPWTDSNYGNIFSLWDRLFGTLVIDDVRNVKYGLDVLDGEKANSLSYQIKVPFDGTIKTDY